MAKTYSAIKTISDQIKNATTAASNTAAIVGGNLGDIVDKIQDVDGAKVPTTTTVNGKPLSGDIILDAADIGIATDLADKVSKTATETIGGTKTFSVSPIIPTPDADMEAATKKYVDDTTVELGETSSTAYRGDRGKTAYDHSQTTGNAHGTTAAQIPNTPAGTIAATTVQGAINELDGDVVQVRADLNKVETDLNLDEYTIAEAFNLLYRKIIALEKLIADGVLGNVQVDSITTIGDIKYKGASIILLGTSAPTVSPDFEGQTYINTTSPGTVYVAKGVASASDWKQTSN